MTFHRLRPSGLVLLLALFVLFAQRPAAAAGATHVSLAGATHVYLVRGIFDVSVGLDALAVELRRFGMASSVYSHTQSGAVAADAISDYTSGRVRRIVLIGHSMGGGAVLSVADELNDAGVPVSLLIALDPTAPGPVTANVRRAVDFYIAGSGATLAAAPDFRGRLQNIDVGRIPGMDHMAVQSMPVMHSRMIGLVESARGG
jgi:pimeloyl-ACP methyl ester carboxylesterase